MKPSFPKSIKPKYSSFVDRSGKVDSFIQPAAFCDTSFLIDYIDSDSHNPDYNRFPWNKENPDDKLFREYLKSEQRTKQIYRIREIIENFDNKLNLVYSPACRLELEEVLSEYAFRNYGVEVSDIKHLQRKSRKEIGDIINKIRLDSKLKGPSNELNNLYYHFFLITDNITEFLPGLYEVDLINIRITKKDFYKFGFLANLQIGFADIFHLISTQRLGCKYFFTLDKDFARASSEIESIFNFEVVTEIDKMVDLVKK